MGAGRDLHGLRKDGKEFPIEIGLNPIETEDGLMVLSAIVDISERKAGEQAMRQSEARIREVVESVLHGLVVVDQNGRIALVNRQLETMFDYKREELIGGSIEQLMPERYRGQHRRLFDSFFSSPSVRDMAARRELYARRRDGTEFPVEIGLNPVRSAGQLQVLATITDVTARKAAEAEIERALAEKTALLNEVHHRVKNNLQVVASLLRLQSRSASPEARAVLAESQDRVKVMALIHQLLYERSDFSRLHLGIYLERLVTLLHESHRGAREQVRIAIAGSQVEVYLDLQRAIPCGLLVNELVTNAFKHAFAGAASGTVSLELSAPAPGRGRLVVADDGIGLPVDVEVGTGNSLGLQLVPLLVDQLHGELNVVRGKGTRFELDFASE